MKPDQQSTILITCARGLINYLQAEVEQLGYQPDSVHDTGLELTGDHYDTMLLNLHLRTAYNVLYLLKEFSCSSPDDLYRNVYTLPWEDIIPNNEYLSVVGRIDTSIVDNTMFASLKTKDAIVDRIANITGSRPDSGKERSNVVVQLYWKGDRCWLYLNTSGKKISDRNYRKIPHTAPLRECLASAIIDSTGYDGSVPLVCPMCGSATLAIEAALLACRRVPNLLRSNYGFMHTKFFDNDAWQQMRAAAQKKSKSRGGKAAFKPARIIATDIDPKVVTDAQQNAKTAGVDHLIEFATCDFADTTVPDEPGIIIMNPEYGMRMGETQQLKSLHRRIGDFLKQKCPGYTAYIFTGSSALAKHIGLRTSQRTTFFNGSIECRLLKYDLYAGSQKSKYQKPDEG